MATAKELLLKPGDLAAFASAEIKGPKCDIVGIPLDTPGARIRAAVGKVLALDAPQGCGTATRLQIIWTNYTELPVGTIKDIHAGFKGFISEGDDRLRQEMTNAGLRLQGFFTPDGQLSYEIVQISSCEEDLSLEGSNPIFF